MAKKKPIVSPLGQWAYPGEVTIIPSSNITMKGVNYPVLGVDDLGNSQMMMPGQDYNFPGQYVTEIPQMGKGGLAQWFAEEWTDVKTGKACGRSGKEKGSRPYPACRPKKRINETTPKTTSEMSSAEKAKFKREKTSGKRIDYNHKRREDGGETWLDQYQAGGVRPPIYTSDLSKVRSYNDSNTLYNSYLANLERLKKIGQPIQTNDATIKSNYTVQKDNTIRKTDTKRMIRRWDESSEGKISPLENPVVPKISSLEDLNYDPIQQKYQTKSFPGRNVKNIPGKILEDNMYNQYVRQWYLTQGPDKISTMPVSPDTDEVIKRNLKEPQANLFAHMDATHKYIKPTGIDKVYLDPVMQENYKALIEYRKNSTTDSSGNIVSDSGWNRVNNNINFETKTLNNNPLFIRRYAKPFQPYIYTETPVAPAPVVEPPKPSLFVSNIDRDMYTPGGGMAREYNIGVTLQDGNRKSFRTEKEFQDWKAANNLDISKAKVTEGRGYSYDYPENKKYGGWLNKYQNAGEVPSDIERMQGVDIRKKRSWLDKLRGYVHKGEKAIGLDPYNERSDDFFEQLARRINTATGGKDWYKQPNDASGAGGLPTAMMETVMAPFSIPQLAATYGVTGKVQTPSQAMDIQNPVGAFLTDAALDPLSYVGAGLTKTGQNFIKSLPEQINKAALSQINKNPRLVLSLQRGRPISLDNVNTVSGIRYGDVSGVPNFNKIRPNTISEIDFFKQLEKGAGSLDNSLQKRITDLESEEGFRRLVNQEKEYLFYNSDLEEDALERVAKINARARIDELKNTNNINKEAAEFASSNFLNTGLPNKFVETSQLYDNAFRAAGYDDVLSNMLSKRQGFNLVKPTPNYSKSVPGEIGIGYNYVGSKPTEMHEIAHSLQRGRRLSVDDQLRNIVPKKELTRDQEHAYKYFMKGSDGQEPSAFANELRESMLQSGIIPDYYSPISQQQIQDAYKYFKTKPMGIYDKNTGKFLSSTRILDFMAPNQSNSKLLSDILNELPAVAPLGVGAAAASQLPEQKNGGWLDTYQDGGENLPELNSKIDIANFYKNPLSEKYGIYQDPEDDLINSTYKYYSKSAEKPNISSKTFDFTNLGNIARRIDKKEITTPQPIKYNSKMIDYAADQDYLMALVTEEFPIIPPSFKDVLSNIPELETINTIPKPKALPNKQPVVNNTFAFDSNYWNSADVQAEVFNRQLKDNKWYGDFDKRGDNVLNRTDVKRNYDSEVFLQNLATPNSVVIDIGSALGNNNPKLAGVSVYELASNPKIKSKNIKVIATDIPSEVKGFEELKRRGNSVYPIDYAQVPETFNTPIRNILKAKNLENVKDVYLRAANSIDLLMNVQETSEHFKHISSTLKDKNVTYLYNNTILYKPAGSTKFKKLGNLNNSAFDHRSPSWKNNPNRNHYTLLPTNETGGEISWLNKYK